MLCRTSVVRPYAMTWPFRRMISWEQIFSTTLQDVRAEENGLASRAQFLNKIFQHERRGNVETRHRFVENEHVRIVHEGADQEDALAHALRIRTDRYVTMGRQSKKSQEVVDPRLFATFGHISQRADHVEIFFPVKYG